MNSSKKISRSIITIIVFVICILGSYLCIEHLDFSRNFSNILSFIGLGLILFIIYVSIKNKHFYEKEILLCLVEIGIINRLYDPTVYEKVLQYPIKYIISGVIIVYGLRFSLPLLIKAIRWIYNNVEEKPLKVKNKCLLKKEKQINTITPIKESIEGQKEGKKGNKIIGDVSAESTRKINIKEVILFLLMSALIIILAFHSLTIIFTENQILQSRIKDIPDSYNVYISFILLIVLFIILIGIALVCCFKFLQTLFDIILRRNSPSNVMFYVLGFIVLSFFLNQKGYLSQDKILDFFVSSDIFAFPVFGLICYLVFLLCGSAFNNILSVDKVGESAKELVKNILGIAKGIIYSIIKFFAFITQDMLSGFLELINDNEFTDIKEETENKEKENNKQTDDEKG